MWWLAVVKPEWEQFPLRLDYGRSPHAYVNQRLQIQLEVLMMGGMPLETCWAFNERWKNKFYYKVASCWLFLLSQNKENERGQCWSAWDVEDNNMCCCHELNPGCSVHCLGTIPRSYDKNRYTAFLLSALYASSCSFCKFQGNAMLQFLWVLR